MANVIKSVTAYSITPYIADQEDGYDLSDSFIDEDEEETDQVTTKQSFCKF